MLVSVVIVGSERKKQAGRWRGISPLHLHVWKYSVLMWVYQQSGWLNDGELCPEEREREREWVRAPTGTAAIILTSHWKLWQKLCQNQPSREQELFCLCTINVWHIIWWGLKRRSRPQVADMLDTFWTMSVAYTHIYGQQNERIGESQPGIFV